MKPDATWYEKAVLEIEPETSDPEAGHCTFKLSGQAQQFTYSFSPISEKWRLKFDTWTSCTPQYRYDACRTLWTSLIITVNYHSRPEIRCLNHYDIAKEVLRSACSTCTMDYLQRVNNNNNNNNNNTLHCYRDYEQRWCHVIGFDRYVSPYEFAKAYWIRLVTLPDEHLFFQNSFFQKLLTVKFKLEIDTSAVGSARRGGLKEFQVNIKLISAHKIECANA